MDKTSKNDGAVALLYDRARGDAPRVVAKGRGETADRILEVGRAAGVQVVEDPDLLEILSRFPVGEEIPPDLYQAVAEILAFVYRVNQRYREKCSAASASDVPIAPLSSL